MVNIFLTHGILKEEKDFFLNYPIAIFANNKPVITSNMQHCNKSVQTHFAMVNKYFIIKHDCIMDTLARMSIFTVAYLAFYNR